LWSHEAGIFVYDASVLIDQIATTVVFLLGAELMIYKLISRSEFSSFSVLNCCQSPVQKAFIIVLVNYVRPENELTF